jgi:tetratricopeptide (TPR) repeat protein
MVLGGVLLSILSATAGFAQIEEAIRLQGERKYKEAIAKYEEVLAEKPTDPQALYGIGVSMTTLGGSLNDVNMLRKAVAYLGTLTKNYANYAAYRYYHAVAAGSLAGRLADSVEKTDLLNLAEREIRYAYDNEKQPQTKAMYKGQLAAALAAVHKFDDAESLAKEILDAVPGDEGAKIVLGRVDEGRGYDADAGKKYLEALTANPKSAEAIYRLSLLTQKLDKAQSYKAKVEILDAMVALDLGPFYRAQAYKELAEGRICLDDLQGGIDALVEAEKIKGDDANFPNRLGLVYLAVGDRDNAIKAFQRAMKINPDLLYPYDNLGTELAVAGKVGEACKCFKDGWAAAGRVLAVKNQRPDFKAEAKLYRVLFRWYLDWMEGYRKN